MIYLQFNKKAPASGYWDQNILEECFGRRSHVIVIPGGAQTEYIKQINKRLAEEPYCVVIISSDEEGRFPWQKLKHRFMKIYLQYVGGADRQIPIGAPPNAPTKLDKTIDLMYAGQVNTDDRIACAKAVRQLSGNAYISDGFAQGFDKPKYNELMGSTKTVPCPGGHVSPDSFRLYEALEAGCTPVVNNRDYFTKLLGDFPFPCVDNWSELKGIEYRDYSGWWKNHKIKMAKSLEYDLWILRSSYLAAQ